MLLMNDLYFFYSAKLAVVFFILMFSSATLEAQRNENDKFFDLTTAIAKLAVVFFILMFSSTTLEAQRNENDKFFDLTTAIGEYFGGEFNEAEKALELDLNGANSFLEGLHTFAIREIVRKNENGKFECKKPKQPDFKIAIKAILGQNVPIFGGKKSFKKVQNILKSIIVPKKSDQIPSGSDQIPSESVDSVKFYSDEKLFNLLFSLATRLEALVHGKNTDGTQEEKQENSKEKIQTFLAVSKCFPESKLSIFDYWMKIIEMETKNFQEPDFGVVIYKKKYDVYKSEYRKEDFRHSRESYEILKQLNDQKFSIYESLNLLRATFNLAYTTNNYGDEETNREYAAQLGKQKHILRGKIPQIFEDLLRQIDSVFYFNYFNWEKNEYWDKNKKCEYAMFFQNISENLMKMMSDESIDPELHLDSQDFKMQKYIQNDVEESCKKFDNEEAKIIFLNNVHFQLAINFEFNKRKDIYDRAEDLLSEWIGGDREVRIHGGLRLSEESYLKKNASKMLRKIKLFTLNTNRETISIIEALIEKDHIDQFNLGSLFEQIKTLVEVAITDEEANLEKAKKKINSEQLENDIEFLKKNPKSIAEEKYQKVVAIICTIKQFGEKVKMLTPKIKNIKIQERLKKLSSAIRNIEMKYFGPELWEQTEETCNQLKHKQIEMEEIVSEKILLKDLLFEFKEIWKSNEVVFKPWISSIEGAWRGIEEYYLSIPLMQLIDEVRPLAKTFGKMLQNVKEHYAKKTDE